MMREKSVTEIFELDYVSQNRVVADYNRSIGLLTLLENSSNYWPQ
jgi:hypothetical protein